MKMRKLGALLASSAIISTTLTLVPSATAYSPLIQDSSAGVYSGTCGDVHIVSANGTGWGGRNKQDNASDFMMKPLVERVKSQLPGKVSNYDITYPAAVGAIASLAPQSDNSATYGLSRLEGDMKGLQHLQAFHNKCPNSMVVFTGYSQGASVAGDLAALVANGAVPGMTSDNVLGTVLFADPGRGGTSAYTGPQQPVKSWIPLPPNVKYNRNGEVSTATSNNTVGWTGQRSLPFKGMEGRVISLCNDNDTACATGTTSPLRSLADMSDKNIWPNISYRKGAALFTSVIGGVGNVLPALFSAVPGLLKNDDYTPVFDAMEQQFAVNTTLNKIDRGVLLNAVTELREVFKILHRDDMFGPNTSDRKILGQVLTVAYPMIKPHLKNMGINPQHVDMAEPVISAITGFASGVDPIAIARTTPVLNRIAAFPKEHGVYFNKDAYPVSGKSAMDWGADAIVQGVKNYQSGQANVTQADTRNQGLETAEPNRADDGLHAMLQFLQKGTSVLGQDTNDYPQPRVPVDPSRLPKPGIGSLSELLDEAMRGRALTQDGKSTTTGNTQTNDSPYYSYLPEDKNNTKLLNVTNPDKYTNGDRDDTSTQGSSTRGSSTRDSSRTTSAEEEIVTIVRGDDGSITRKTTTRTVNPSNGEIITPTSSSTTSSATTTRSSASTTAPKDDTKNKDNKDKGPQVNTGGHGTSLWSRIVSIFA